MSSSTSSKTTTTLAPQALTTPFVPPRNCTTQFYTTKFITSLGASTTTVKVLVSGPADAQFSACQPSGWGEGTSSFAFSPAVCPSGWTAYDLGAAGPVTFTQTLSTAFCCASGFKLTYNARLPISGLSETVCIETAVRDVTTISTIRSDVHVTQVEPQFPTGGFRVHTAWHISWGPSDTATLTPSPPPLPSCATSALSIWVPGASVNSSLLGSPCSSVEEHWSSSQTSGFLFMAIGIPIIVLALLCGCLGCWCRQLRRKKSLKTGQGQAGATPGDILLTQSKGT
ncbi:hypothetical protein BX600DRAFT_551376 [Xylariales sp. PMI_506]|nr:hypothetical protein BX600DRAFT_551376 [Xylariales sp. PMI_506]